MTRKLEKLTTEMEAIEAQYGAGPYSAMLKRKALTMSKLTWPMAGVFALRVVLSAVLAVLILKVWP